MTNCLFYGNSVFSSTYNGIIHIQTGTSTIMNCTFADNTGSGEQYIVILVTNNITNCIFKDNFFNDVERFARK